MYTTDSIEDVKSKSNLLEVVEDFVIMKKHGSNWLGLCPKHDEKTPSFYVSLAEGKTMFRCFGCGFTGNDSISFLMQKLNMSYPESLRYLANKYNVTLVEEGSQNYTIPTLSNKTDLSDKIVKWFADRKISQSTLLKMKVTEGIESMPVKDGWEEMNCIHFNYFKNGEVRNIKYRGKNKTFKLYKGAELLLYNLDSLKDKTEAILVEGEPDCLALIEAGYDKDYAVLSVPNGASEHRNNLQYLNNCVKEYAHIEKWHLGFDNDSNGRKLRDEIAERFGKDKCDYIEWKDKKDANDVLKQYGIQGVIECCGSPIKFPLEGAFTISDIGYEIDDMYAHGLDRGISIGMQGFNLRFVKGYINVVTGVPASGKSELVDEIGLRMTIRENYKGAFYSPENKPTQLHYSKMARRLVGKQWDGANRITKEENKQVQDFLDKKIWFIKPEKDFSLTSILKSIRELQLRYGLDYFVIDAWNKLEHKETDTHAVGRQLDELSVFCEAYNLLCFLVAHPSKMEKNKKTGEYDVPSLYNISGSANFYNKTDNGIAITIDRYTKSATWHILKVKFSHWGWVSKFECKWEPNSGRYFVDGHPDFKNWITGKENSNYSGELPLEGPGVVPFDESEPPF